MKNIVISGTPGTGKTSVAHELAKLIHADIISLNELAINENYTLEYDNKRETYIVDFDRFIPYIIKVIEDHQKAIIPYLIIEAHFSDIVPDDYIDYAFILRCDPDELYKRLEKKNYKKEKIIENIQAEILGNCANYMLQKKIKTPLLEIDTSELGISSVAKLIQDIITNKLEHEKYIIGKVDWLEQLAKTDRLNDFFD